MTLVEQTLEARFLEVLPEKLIGDRAYDSDPLDEHLLEEYGVEMIAPHRSNRKKKEPRMAENCVDIKKGGKSKGCLPGFRIFAVVLFDMSTIKPTLKLF